MKVMGFFYCFDQLIDLDEVRQKALLWANEDMVLLVCFISG